MVLLPDVTTLIDPVFVAGQSMILPLYVGLSPPEPPPLQAVESASKPIPKTPNLFIELPLRQSIIKTFGFVNSECRCIMFSECIMRIARRLSHFGDALSSAQIK